MKELSRNELADKLSAKADRAYCEMIDQSLRVECLGWEAKVKSGQFGQTEYEAHKRVGGLYGQHIAYVEAAKLVRELVSEKPASTDYHPNLDGPAEPVGLAMPDSIGTRVAVDRLEHWSKQIHDRPLEPFERARVADALLDAAIEIKAARSATASPSATGKPVGYIEREHLGWLKATAAAHGSCTIYSNQKDHMGGSKDRVPLYAEPPTESPPTGTCEPGICLVAEARGQQYVCDGKCAYNVSAIGGSTGPLSLDTDSQVFFYEQDHYYLSNFSSFKVNWQGFIFDTSEHAYHWTRFPAGSPERRIILESSSAHDAFRFAQENKSRQIEGWDGIKVRAMREILTRKAEQHEYVRRKLLQTGNRMLIENSWRDPYWGWGPNRDGQNMLGKVWMEVRAELRAAVNAPDRTKAP